MICLSLDAVFEKSPEQVAELLRKSLPKLPVTCHGLKIKLSPEAKKALGGKKKAHEFVDQVTEFLHWLSSFYPHHSPIPIIFW